jgi:hypothetical protein
MAAVEYDHALDAALHRDEMLEADPIVVAYEQDGGGTISVHQ